MGRRGIWARWGTQPHSCRVKALLAASAAQGPPLPASSTLSGTGAWQGRGNAWAGAVSLAFERNNLLSTAKDCATKWSSLSVTDALSGVAESFRPGYYRLQASCAGRGLYGHISRDSHYLALEIEQKQAQDSGEWMVRFQRRPHPQAQQVSHATVRADRGGVVLTLEVGLAT